MNVLIATPTYADKLQPATVAAVQAQKFSGKWEWRVYRNNPRPTACMANVLAQYQHIQRDFLAGSWDALLTVEHDMIPPAHALQALADAAKPVAYGVYLLRHGSLVLNAWEYSGRYAMGESYSLQTRRARRIKPDGLVRVSGVGFGCTLIRRDVLETLPIHGGGNPDRSPDVPFAEDCNRLDIEQWAHFGVICGHIEGGKVLMPEGESGAECRVLALQTLNARVGGASVHLDAGQEYTLVASGIDDLVRAGYVRILDAPAGSGDALLQAPADAPAQRAKPQPAKRSRLGAKLPG